MTTCDKCNSIRILTINAKSNDSNIVDLPHLAIKHCGYLPRIPGICGGDYVNISICLNCGTVIGYDKMFDLELVGLDELQQYMDSDDEDDW